MRESLLHYAELPSENAALRRSRNAWRAAAVFNMLCCIGCVFFVMWRMFLK